MIQYQKTNLCTKFKPPITLYKMMSFLQNTAYGSDVTMMTSLSQNQFLQKILVNFNPLAKFSVPITFGLGVRWRAFFATPV